MSEPVFRFAPSPNGPLHLGHARSALMAHAMARAAGGRFLIRIEDIDLTRCRPEHERAILSTLTRLGLSSDGPIRRQSEHFDDYARTLDRLKALDLVYPAFLTRAEIRARISEREASGMLWPRDPDGVPHYPGDCASLDPAVAARMIEDGAPFAWRLNMDRAIALAWAGGAGDLAWLETGGGDDGDAIIARAEGHLVPHAVPADPAVWGDVIVARREIPTSYHLSVVVDDALQGITDVVRGVDLFAATTVHRLLQTLLGLPVPRYHHHALVLDGQGRKLSKSDGDGGLDELLTAGIGVAEIRRLVGL